jgi:hypothetical protein
MIDQQFTKQSDSFLLNILGMLRWAQLSEGGGWNVESTFLNGTMYMAYHTYEGVVVWDVRARGRYPDNKEFAELEAACDNLNS